MQLGYASPKTLNVTALPWDYAGGRPGVGGLGDDPKCIFVIAETYATTFINNIFSFDQLLV